LVARLAPISNFGVAFPKADVERHRDARSIVGVNGGMILILPRASGWRLNDSADETLAVYL
jgi:hypothetical protein